MKAVSIRVAHRGKGKAAGQRRHDTRTGPQPAYVDASRSSQNSVIVEPMKEAALRDECEARRSQRPGLRAMRSDAAIATTGVLTFGHEAQRVLDGLTPDEQDRRIHAAAEAAAEHMGTTLTGLVVHRDESALHAHFQMPAIRRDGHPVSKRLDRQGTSAMQDVAAQAFADLGISRGTPKVERQARGEDASRWVHRSVRELHDDLPAEIAKARAKAEKNRRLIEQTQAKIEAGTGDLAKLEKRLETYQKREKAALAMFEQVPEPVTVERVKKREKGALGLGERIETDRVKAYLPKAFKQALTAAGDRLRQEADQRAELLDERESRVQMLERGAEKAEKRRMSAITEAREAEGEADAKRAERDAYADEISKASKAIGAIGYAASKLPGATDIIKAVPGRIGQELRRGVAQGRQAAQEREQAAMRDMGDMDQPKRDRDQGMEM
ncbi:MAG: plasmid recombination protein [Halothiobacillaceae bacterium]|nr:plasmid recombination protein [Halothiobacillaceae bacterium]